MGWTLSPGVSFCIADGHAIFLKLAEDRYVRPAQALNDRFLKWLASGGSHSPPAALVESGLLIHTDAPCPFPVPCIVQPATEALTIPHSGAVSAVPVAAAGLLRARAEVWFRPLDKLLADRVRRKTGRTRVPGAETCAKRFLAARAALPLKRRCLPDSLALFDLLVKRGCHPMLVFGIVPEPFAAHCWVQVGDTVFNDSVDTVSRFQAILVL